MRQLSLTKEKLEGIGFTKKTYPANDMNPEKTTYEIKTINGCFSYNETDSYYRWYHKTVIGDAANHVHLNIESLPELFIVLACFRAKYNFNR